MEFLVPMSKNDWGFFERQRSVFKQSHSAMDDEWSSFDAELERIKRDMFQLTPMDFGGGMGGSLGMDMDLGISSKSSKTAIDFGGGLGSKMDAEFAKMEAEMDAMMGGVGGSRAPALTGSSTTSTKVSTKSVVESSSSVKTGSSESSSSSKSVEESSLTGSGAKAALGGSSNLALTSAGSSLTSAGSSGAGVKDLMLQVEHPIVSGPDGMKRLTLRFDVSKFKPEEISVKTVDRTLTVHAKHTEESPGKKIYREYSKQYILPKNIDPLALTSTLATDGVLQIEAPAPEAIEAPPERLIPVLRLLC